MKTFLFASVLASLVLATPRATAASIDVPGFTLAETTTGDTGKLELLSNDGATARIAITGFDGFELWGERDSYWIERNVALAGTVQPGYRIDSLTLSGTMYGSRTFHDAPNCARCTVLSYNAGGALTSAYARWTLMQGDVSLQLPTVEVSNLEGVRPFLATYQTGVSGTFGLSLAPYLWAVAHGGDVEFIDEFGNWDFTWTDWDALIGMKDVVLTVQVSAVPEPATYAMLLAGLGVAGLAGRRRTRLASN